jgi:succinyl-diaminopimelate desuccinylase
MDYTKKITDFLAAREERMILLQKVLTSIPAIAPEFGGDGEWEKAAALLDWLKGNGIKDAQLFPADDRRVTAGKRPNIVVTLPGEDQAKAFWIMSHLDVVPSGDASAWRTDPFALTQSDGRIYGRGVEDNQQGLISSLFALLVLKELKIVPPQTLKLLIVADEEVSSEYGVRYLLRQTELFSDEDVFLVPDGGEPEGKQIEISEKSILWLKFTTRGKQAHASRPDTAVNAFLAASALVLKLHDLGDFFIVEDPLFVPPVSTFSPTKKEENIPNINTIPGEDVFYLDCRVLPSLLLDDVLSKIGEICALIEKEYGVTVEYKIEQRLESSATSGDCRLAVVLSSVIESVLKVTPVLTGVGGGTVAADLRNTGFDTVVWSTIDETAHMPNEYCVIENMIGDSVVMALTALSQIG